MRRITVGFLLVVAAFAGGHPAAAQDDERIKVFIDQDTSGPAGTDSVSIALLLQAPNIDVVGIGVVAGGAWLDQAVYHTLKIVELTGKTHVPVAAGSEVPLLNSQAMMERREELWGEKAGGMPPGTPLADSNELPGAAVVKDGCLIPTDAPGFRIDVDRRWLERVSL